MLKTYGMIMNELKSYNNPKAKLGRMVASGIYIPVIRGLYETDPGTPGYVLAGSIYGPSYLSFDFALSYYGLIPERVTVYTSATFGKNRSKSYATTFGQFTYRDVPKRVYPLGICLQTEGDYTFQIASREKAVCDKLYTMHPVRNQKQMLLLLAEDLRIDLSKLESFDSEDILVLSELYHSTNVTLFHKLLRRIQK